jgi:hypothetical protein
MRLIHRIFCGELLDNSPHHLPESLPHGLISICGMSQKNHAEHRHRLFRGREVGVGTELIGGFPQAGFNLRDVVEGVDGHLCGGLIVIFGGLQRGRE